MAELTPMKIQYNEIKSRYQDSILFFRLGDFYEMFDEDAILVSQTLGIALTTRDRKKEKEEQTPMCGVPFHSADTYINRLVKRGYKVAICEQLTDPALAKGIVKRDVVKVITPGTVIDPSMLDETCSNYVSAVFLENDSGAIAFCDLTTGEFCAAEFPKDAETHLMNELGRFSPREILFSSSAIQSLELLKFADEKLMATIAQGADKFSAVKGEALLCKQFCAENLSILGLNEGSACVAACGALLTYLEETQKCELVHITKFDLFKDGKFMELDITARRSLEICQNQRTGERHGSLLWVLDRTKTAIGARTLRSWLERPLLSPLAIRRRQTAVAQLYENNALRSEIMRSLSGFGDMQRLINRISLGRINARELLNLAGQIEPLSNIKSLLANSKSANLSDIAEFDHLSDIAFQIYRGICDDPAVSLREGGLLRKGYSERVDKLRTLKDNGAQMIADLEARERERTGIKKLKVGYNRVFGYYIDIPNSAGDIALPEEYIRKQTLVSNERYFTEELKNLESDLLNAKESLAELEYNYFCQICDYVSSNATRIKETSILIGELDALCSLAEVAVRNNYVCPEIDYTGEIIIKEGRHPVVEASLRDELFVPNDTLMNNDSDRMLIITGPNMAGKSTFMRQTALIVLMAQIGSFVPAKSAKIGLVDRVFTRIGASDDLASGQSTFMVEMVELSNIVKNATVRSLIILDEVGRGTSTYDGMAIARAVLEYCADKRKLGAKTLFATHYHELTTVENSIEGVRNYHTSAKMQSDKLVFLRKVIRGSASDSYGIEVAKLAGVPNEIVRKASKYLRELEEGKMPEFTKKSDDEAQVSFTNINETEIAEKLRTISLDTMSPLEALNLLYELKRKADY